MRFAVYKHRLVYDGDRLIEKQFIVLKDEEGNITGWTEFHKYADRKGLRNLYGGHNNKCYDIVKLLNYVFFGKYHIRKLTELTTEMVIDFFRDYGLCRLPDDSKTITRSKATVERCINHVYEFLKNVEKDYPACRFRPERLFKKESVYTPSRKRKTERTVPDFTVYYRQSENKIFRDIPEGAFQIIMSRIATSHRNILMLAALSAFAGLRPSEACNVRRPDSALGPGLLFDITDGEVTNVTIDLTAEKPLRSDLVSVGSIKKERRQKVYPAFLGVFMDCYNMYMKHLEGKPYEKAYGALTNTSGGKAYTYAAYRSAFKKAVEESIPEMLDSDDPQTVNYGMLLLEHGISPHILRHFFSVKLTLYGEDVAGLMNWRGDSSPESALTYLENKSDLEKQYRTVSENIFNYTLWKAGKEADK